MAQQAEAEESDDSSDSSEIDDWELTAELHEREKRKAQRESMRRYDPDARKGVVADELRAAKAEVCASAPHRTLCWPSTIVRGLQAGVEPCTIRLGTRTQRVASLVY